MNATLKIANIMEIVWSMWPLILPFSAWILMHHVVRYSEPIIYKSKVRRARAELSKYGLTPEQYIATLDQTNVIAIANAKTRFGID